MKFTVSKEALLDGLQTIQNVVSSRTTLPVLSNVLIETLDSGIRLTTTDLEVGIRRDIEAQIEKQGSTTLPARRFLSVVRELPSKEIQFETDSKHISAIKCGPSFFKMY
ncbi:MAG: DNA polymerase III subunit beta, partial [Chthoniobacterales bacterium]